MEEGGGGLISRGLPTAKGGSWTSGGKSNKSLSHSSVTVGCQETVHSPHPGSLKFRLQFSALPAKVLTVQC